MGCTAITFLIRTIPLALITCVLGGCIFDTPPAVAVDGIRCVAISESDPPHVELAVDLVLENPTDKPIQLEKFDYSVSIDSGNRWSGTWSALRTLPAREKVPMQLPAIVIDPFADQDATTQWRISGTISYKAPGRIAQILFDTGFRRPTHDFSGRGDSIPIPESPETVISPRSTASAPEG